MGVWPMLSRVIGVVLAVACFACVFVGHVAVSHTVKLSHRERMLLGFMAAGAVLYSLLFFVLDDRAIGSPKVELPRWVQYVTGAAAFGFLALGYTEFWSLFERSFSLRILIDCERSPIGLTRGEIAQVYGGGIGLDGMFDKRTQGLIGAGIIAPHATTYRLTARGRFVARLFRGLASGLRLTR